MQIVLLKNVPHLGSLGDRVQVKDGYARNYLIPQGLAINIGSKSKRILHRVAHLEKHRQLEIEEATRKAKVIESLAITVFVPTAESGTLYGALSASRIASELNSIGYSVLPNNVLIGNPIKNIGKHEVSVRLHTEINARLEVTVVDENAPTAAEEATEATTDSSPDAAPESSHDAGAEVSSEASPESSTETEETPSA